MSLKQAAEELLKIADEMEKDAAEVTRFVCDVCNHTTTLASINEKRAAVAKEAGNVTADEITVNDQVFCPACDGVMAYRATEASSAYYFDPDKKAEEEEKPEEEKPAEEAPEGVKECKTAYDYDSLNRYLS